MPSEGIFYPQSQCRRPSKLDNYTNVWFVLPEQFVKSCANEKFQPRLFQGHGWGINPTAAGGSIYRPTKTPGMAQA